MHVEIFQFDVETDDRTFHNGFKKLVELHRNDEVKSILIREFTRSSPFNIVDSYGDTLLHMAAIYNNLELIDFLLKSGCDVDAKNSYGKTPLSMAIFFNCIEAIVTLVNANAEFWTTDALSILKLLISKKDTLPASLSRSFMQKLKECCENLKIMADLLVNVNCPLTFVVHVSDARLTQIMLETSAYKINNEDSLEALRYVMELADFENLRVLWRSNRMNYSRITLFNEIKHSTLCTNWKYMRPLFQHLTDWIILDDDFQLYLKMIFSSGNREDFHVLLEQYNVDVQLRNEYEFHVLPFIFRNKQLNIEDLTEISYKRLMDVNVKSFEGMSSLHYAAISNSTNSIRLLIELGANCNVKNDNGLTPLWYPRNVDCIELLLQSGADPYVTRPVNGKTVLDEWLRNPHSDVTKILLAQLAIDYHRGVAIKQTIFDRINRNETYRDHYEDCLKQVREMMNCELLPSFTVFSVITKKLIKNISNQIQSQETVCSIVKWCSEQYFHSYYCSLLELILKKTYTTYRTKRRIALIISESLLVAISFDNLVIDRICDFLSERDMLVFLSA